MKKTIVSSLNFNTKLELSQFYLPNGIQSNSITNQLELSLLRLDIPDDKQAAKIRMIVLFLLLFTTYIFFYFLYKKYRKK